MPTSGRICAFFQNALKRPSASFKRRSKQALSGVKTNNCSARYQALGRIRPAPCLQNPACRASGTWAGQPPGDRKVSWRSPSELRQWYAQRRTHRGERTIWGGRASVRSALYMAAMTATQHNRRLRTFYHRLLDRGKPNKVALVAVMRKLLIILNAMVKNQTAWNPDLNTAST